MICKKCGRGNVEGSKYCTNCGTELIKENQPQKNICESCGSENEPANKYCTICGEKLPAGEGLQNESPKQSYQDRGTNNEKKHKNKVYPSVVARRKTSGMTIGVKPIFIALAVLFIVIGIVAVVNSLSEKSEVAQYPTETKSSNPVVEAKVFEIASKFVCSCGSCNEESLEKCKCAIAVEEREFVRDYLEKKGKPEDIIAALANKYGYLKAEYANAYNIDKSKTWSSTTLQYPSNSVGAVNPNRLETKATFANVTEIYSAFKCPCGQCSIDELRNCDCSHKNGAKEIKAFIDDRLRENKYTVNEIVNLVQAWYGGRKL